MVTFPGGTSQLTVVVLSVYVPHGHNMQHTVGIQVVISDRADPVSVLGKRKWTIHRPFLISRIAEYHVRSTACFIEAGSTSDISLL